MKTIYELIYTTKDGNVHNVLFADADKANQHRELYYKENSIVDESVIDHSFVISRILF